MTKRMAIARRRISPAPTPLQDNHGGHAPASRAPVSGTIAGAAFLSIVVLVGLLMISGHAGAAPITALAALSNALLTADTRIRRQH
jgi:hypothetical protein